MSPRVSMPNFAKIDARAKKHVQNEPLKTRAMHVQKLKFLTNHKSGHAF